LNQQDWKTTFITSGARHHVVSHFVRCLRLIDARMLEEARLYLRRDAWRTGLDLTGVPPHVLDRTEDLRLMAHGLIDQSNGEPVSEVVDEIIDLWS
jgi:hypothetical protein